MTKVRTRLAIARQVIANFCQRQTALDTFVYAFFSFESFDEKKPILVPVRADAVSNRGCDAKVVDWLVEIAADCPKRMTEADIATLKFDVRFSPKKQTSGKMVVRLPLAGKI
jgi:hypothetical protein